MIPLLALWEGVKGGLREHVFKVMKVVQYGILEGLWLHFLDEGLCQMLQHGLTGTDLHNVWWLGWQGC